MCKNVLYMQTCYIKRQDKKAIYKNVLYIEMYYI